jgi:hypothetical protein
MNLNQFNQFKIALVPALLLLLQCCTSAPGVRKNELISSGIRNDFRKRNEEVFNYLKAKDEKGMHLYFSRELNAENNARLIGLIGNYLNDNDYQLLYEYYFVHKNMDADTMQAKGDSTNRYGLICPNEAPEMYMAYFVPKKSDNKLMISLVYGKLDYGWKIIKLAIEHYTVNGKTAPELYALAHEQYDKKELQAALNNVSLAVECFAPGPYWQYPEKDSATWFYGKLNQEANEKYYNHALVLQDISTGPKVLRVYNKTTDDGTYPMVYYLTHYPVDDTVKIKKENLEVQKSIAKLMPGLGENNKYILYSAFNEEPGDYKTVAHFDMEEKVH